MSSEYCCTIVRIGEIKPIEGSDFLGQVMVEGRNIVVRKDEVKENDIMFYVQNECQLNKDFLSTNNLFDDKEMNEDKTKCGYINKHGRIRMIKLRGVLSMGFLFSVDSMKKWVPNFNMDLNENIGLDFDTVNGELFVKAYVPETKERHYANKENKRQKKLNAFERLIPGKFMFHYDTQQLNRNINRFNPNDVLSISVKVHGTSFIIGNVLTKKPRFNGWYLKIYNYLPNFLRFSKNAYDVIYSSRNVIKNKDINTKQGEGYYEQDIWGEYYKLFKDYIPQGMTIYGEIFGYQTDSNKMIQIEYDYGCKPGTNKLMIYRISVEDEITGKKEWNISEIIEWTNNLLKNNPHLSEHLIKFPLLYHGTLKDLYPHLDTQTHWNENVLESLKNDKKLLGMEMDEPLCRNKVPREGICVRIDDDVINECFKLKTLSFLNRESKIIDSGKSDDLEMEEKYG
jgi:hypothetical protein